MRPMPSKLSQIIDQDLLGCRNLGLILDKYQPWKHSNSLAGWTLQFQIQKRSQGNWLDYTIEEISEAKGHWFAREKQTGTVKRKDDLLNPTERIDTDVYDMYFTRWCDMIQAAGGSFLEMCNVSRLVVGLGAKGSLEMGLTLHHHIGYPWIPGSAVKGAARSWALLWLAEQWRIPAVDNREFLQRKEDELETPLQKLDSLIETPVSAGNDPSRYDGLERKLRSLQDDPLVIAAASPLLQINAADIANDPAFKKITSIFGGLGRAGEIIFFGAMTTTRPRLVPEIITPHFNRYYREGHAPLDTDKPSPNVFLALEEGQNFYFGLAPRSPKTTPALLQKAGGYLQKALKELGIGGKTSSGMGLFEPSS